VRECVCGGWTTHTYYIPNVHRKILIEALAMIEGSIPPSTLKPSLHCVGHYPDHALLYGLLRIYWMMVFERYNKFIRDLCYNKHWPMASVANAYLRRAAASYKVRNPPNALTPRSLWLISLLS